MTLWDLLQLHDYAGPDSLDLKYATLYCDGSGAEGGDQECLPGATYVTHMAQFLYVIYSTFLYLQ